MTEHEFGSDKWAAENSVWICFDTVVDLLDEAGEMTDEDKIGVADFVIEVAGAYRRGEIKP